eukprot:1244712-Amorphochlora_amoeboformis.AAC.2
MGACPRVFSGFRRRSVILFGISFVLVMFGIHKNSKDGSKKAKISPPEHVPLSTLAWEWVKVHDMVSDDSTKTSNEMIILSVGDPETVLIENRKAYARKHGLRYVHCGCDLPWDVAERSTKEAALGLKSKEPCPKMNTGKWQ